MLRPQKNVHKCLISTPANIVGEYEDDELLITHAWPELSAPSIRSTRFNPGPTSRFFYIVAFETEAIKEEEKKLGIPVARYHWIGDFYITCLGVFYGKRFDHHGMIESDGYFCLPNYRSIDSIDIYQLSPYNSKPRIDLGIELNLTRLETIKTLLHQQVNQTAFDTFFTAGSFYMRALRLYEENPEMAYLDLVTAGEILSNYYEYTEKELFGNDILSVLNEVREQLPNGEKLAQKIKNRVYQVRRRFKLTLTQLLNDNFFTKTEAEEPYVAFEQKGIESRIAAAYDLRSRYVHTGERFGGWVTSLEKCRAEKLIGSPVVDDKKYKKILEKAPTFIGLERIMRYCLLRFIHKEMFSIEARLD